MVTRPIAETVDERDVDDAEQRRRQREKNLAAIGLLDSWLAETDPDVIREQRETLDYLMKALDEHRSHRKLFS